MEGATLVTMELSSSEVRKRIKALGPKGAEGLVPPSVLSHVERYDLYKDG